MEAEAIHSELETFAEQQGLTLELGPSPFGFRAGLRLAQKNTSGDRYFLSADASSATAAERALLHSLQALRPKLER